MIILKVMMGMNYCELMVMIIIVIMLKVMVLMVIIYCKYVDGNGDGSGEVSESAKRLPRSQEGSFHAMRRCYFGSYSNPITPLQNCLFLFCGTLS